MLSIREIIAMLNEKFPDKRIRGRPMRIGTDDVVLFAFVRKDATEEEAMWIHTVVGVNQVTGEISWHDAFDRDIMEGAKGISEY